IEGVLVHSSLITKRSSGGIEMTRTDTEGRFAVYGYEEKFFVQNTEQDIYTARIFFFDDRYIHAELRELESVALPMRGALRVVLRAGCTVSGTVKGTDGMPVPDIAVSITDTQDNPLSFEMNRKEGRTDSRGQFSFAGIDSGKATLRVVDVQGNRKSIQELTISETKQEVVVTLEDFKPPIESTHKVLGMTMASVTDEMDQAYDLQRQNTKGVMIIDPGDRFEDFGIGQLRSGDVFWMVGNDAVHDLRTMVRQMVKEAQSPTVPRGASGNRNTSAWILEDGTAMVGVVYGYNDDRGHGTNTQYMKLTPQDVTELEQLLSVLAAGTDD
ncbi:MAG: carboxypeptidase-like regulatory domain-containing protein, partial [Planctomyces sp.]